MSRSALGLEEKSRWDLSTHRLQNMLVQGWASGRRICLIGGMAILLLDVLAGRDLTTVTVVDSDEDKLFQLFRRQAFQIVVQCSDPLVFLKRAASQKQVFDLIFTADFSIFSFTPEMREMLGKASELLRPGGTIVAVGAQFDREDSGTLDLAINELKHGLSCHRLWDHISRRCGLAVIKAG